VAHEQGDADHRELGHRSDLWTFESIPHFSSSWIG
jgi:hypothetical protein